ncbi:hypothetical protein [Mesorhizobium sp.]|uniref:hypothetical protein n=1 Tax=Mesorhizobium sp. TaxID=1871066 RepID=UPI000FE6FF86|nr:hypothetical protein [Mesorhizobium sp.]RWD43899.1 MAG: hypothetical protein EOS35_18640 [Mesorhizobium sp.]TIU09974.1 MAG: hypothetical protein E5W39_01710 [Mesorhizobium sp.]
MITQELFDTIYLGLQAQGWQRSFDSQRDLCMYRGPEGRKCAIGQAIPDDEYDQAMDDGDDVGDVFICDDFHRRDMFMDLTKDQFIELQRAHDINDEPDQMRAAFEDIAGKYGLVIPS